MAANRERLRGLACAVLALRSDQPFELILASDMGAHWVPRMPHVTQATFELHLFGEDDNLDPSVDWLADRLPLLDTLRLRSNQCWLSPEAPLPPLRRLFLNGEVRGMRRTFAQLESLSVDMLVRENCVAAPFHTTTMAAAAQAPHLTQLSLHCIYPENASFFAHLSTATQLRNLAIAHSLTDDEPFTEGNEAAVQLLSAALTRLTALTALDLSGVCPEGIPEGVGALAALQKLELHFNYGIDDLPAGPFRSSLTELEAEWSLAEAALRAGPMHALWDLPQLRVLSVGGLWGASAGGKAEFKAAAAERLPALRKLAL